MVGNGFKLLTTKATIDNGSMFDHFWPNVENTNIVFGVFDDYWIDHHASFISIPLVGS